MNDVDNLKKEIEQKRDELDKQLDAIEATKCEEKRKRNQSLVGKCFESSVRFLMISHLTYSGAITGKSFHFGEFFSDSDISYENFSSVEEILEYGYVEVTNKEFFTKVKKAIEKSFEKEFGVAWSDIKNEVVR